MIRVGRRNPRGRILGQQNMTTSQQNCHRHDKKKDRFIRFLIFQLRVRGVDGVTLDRYTTYG